MEDQGWLNSTPRHANLEADFTYSRPSETSTEVATSQASLIATSQFTAQVTDSEIATTLVDDTLEAVNSVDAVNTLPKATPRPKVAAPKAKTPTVSSTETAAAKAPVSSNAKPQHTKINMQAYRYFGY
jgi:hypothetical protein